MTSREATFVAIRLMAMWLFVSAVVELAAAPAMDWGVPGEVRWAQLLAVGSIVIFPIFFGVPLWVGAARLANRVSIEADASVTPSEPIRASNLYTTGISLLGVIVVVQVLPELAQWTAFAIAARFAPAATEPIDTALQLQRWLWVQAGMARGVSLIVRLIIGIVLLVGPRRVWRTSLDFLRRGGPPIDEGGESGDA